VDWKTPKGVGAGKQAKIKEQIARQKQKSVLNVLMHVQSETAKDLDSFIRHLKQWGHSFVRP
jgi:hypothetical protein